MIADDFAGREGEPDRSGRAWAEFYRFLDHTRSRNACLRAVNEGIEFPEELLDFSATQPRRRFSNRGSIAEKSVPAPSSSSTKAS